MGETLKTYGANVIIVMLIMLLCVIVYIMVSDVIDGIYDRIMVSGGVISLALAMAALCIYLDHRRRVNKVHIAQASYDNTHRKMALAKNHVSRNVVAAMTS